MTEIDQTECELNQLKSNLARKTHCKCDLLQSSHDHSYCRLLCVLSPWTVKWTLQKEKLELQMLYYSQAAWCSFKTLAWNWMLSNARQKSSSFILAWNQVGKKTLILKLDWCFFSPTLMVDMPDSKMCQHEQFYEVQTLCLLHPNAHAETLVTLLEEIWNTAFMLHFLQKKCKL